MASVVHAVDLWVGAAAGDASVAGEGVFKAIFCAVDVLNQRLAGVFDCPTRLLCAICLTLDFNFVLKRMRLAVACKLN